MVVTATPRKTRTTRTVARRAAGGRRAAGVTLLPVMRPTQNMREIIKQLIMLEDHLFQSCKRCRDCINKHMVMIEGLAEECATLCTAKNSAAAADAARVATAVRVAHHAHSQAPKDPRVCVEVGDRLRALRKGLMAKYATLPADLLPTDERAAMRDILRSAKKRRAA